jgi:hypothetical protein
MTTATKRRENVRGKGARLLVSGRLRVTSVLDGEIRAECRGDSGEVYKLGRYDEVWRCSCPARTACSHLHALWAVTAVDR